MLASIARALEQRDQTLGHGARVASLAEPVAVALGWDRERIHSLRTAAPIHDVGKVKVRPQLLGKTGPLTLEEVAEIRTHPVAGAQLIVPLRRFHDALPYVLFHHERWDGKGYPAGLSGRRIPIEARIVAIADAFDAMISPRPYRRALTHEHALAEVEEGAGGQFDPLAAELFVEAWAEGWDTWSQPGEELRPSPGDNGTPLAPAAAASRRASAQHPQATNSPRPRALPAPARSRRP